jgi:hypothetical protein
MIEIGETIIETIGNNIRLNVYQEVDQETSSIGMRIKVSEQWRSLLWPDHTKSSLKNN